MRIVLAMLVVFAANPAFAAWEKMVSSGGVDIFIDPQTIKINGSNRAVLALIAYSDVMPNGARSVSGRVEYDCKERRFRTLSFNQYAEPLAQGILVSGNEAPSDWSSVSPETFAAQSLDRVCKK